MHRFDRFANALDKAVVISKSAVNLCKGSGRKDDVGEASRIRLEKLLHDQEVQFAKRLFTPSQMCRQETSCYIHGMDRIVHTAQKPGNIHTVIHSHVMRAHTVIEKRQRVEQNAPAFCSESIRKLSKD